MLGQHKGLSAILAQDRISRASWLLSLTELASPGFNKETLPQKTESNQERHPMSMSGFHIHMSTCIHIHIHAKVIFKNVEQLINDIQSWPLASTYMHTRMYTCTCTHKWIEKTPYFKKKTFLPLMITKNIFKLLVHRENIYIFSTYLCQSHSRCFHTL